MAIKNQASFSPHLTVWSCIQLAKMLVPQDLAIFMLITIDIQTNHFTPCTCAQDNNLYRYCPLPLLDPPLEPRRPPLPLTLGSTSKVGAGPTNSVVERGEEEGGGAGFCFRTALLMVSFKPPPPRDKGEGEREALKYSIQCTCM